MRGPPVQKNLWKVLALDRLVDSLQLLRFSPVAHSIYALHEKVEEPSLALETGEYLESRVAKRSHMFSKRYHLCCAKEYLLS